MLNDDYSLPVPFIGSLFKAATVWFLSQFDASVYYVREICAVRLCK